jgi:hypothetical protein
MVDSGWTIVEVQGVFRFCKTYAFLVSGVGHSQSVFRGSARESHLSFADINEFRKSQQVPKNIAHQFPAVNPATQYSEWSGKHEISIPSDTLL